MAVKTEKYLQPQYSLVHQLNYKRELFGMILYLTTLVMISNKSPASIVPANQPLSQETGMDANGEWTGTYLAKGTDGRIH
jgi:hypothetical protein